jgi:hypothetical protein
MPIYQMNDENELDWFGLEMFIEEEMMKNTLPITIKQQAQILFSATRAQAEQAIHNCIEFHRRMKWCEATGHNNGLWIVDDSYGGPETGSIGYHCKKCGFSHEVTLY